jgi:hypothetical protein
MHNLILTFIIFSLLPINEESIYNFHLESQAVQYRKVFEVEFLSEDELIDKLNSFLPTFSGLSNIQFNGTVFSGYINEWDIDIKKYGAKGISSWVMLSQKMNSKLTIQVKENRYRIVLSDIQFIAYDPLDFNNSKPFSVTEMNNVATKKRGTEFSTSNTVLNGLELLDKFLTDKFDISIDQLDDDW